jgi:hypothetical protein
MDPLTMSIVRGLVANGLWATIAHVAESPRRRQEMLHEDRQAFEREIGLQTILQRAATTAAKKFGASDGDLSDRAKAFLVSPEVEAIIRQIYAVHLEPGLEGSTREDLLHEFSKCYLLHTGEEADLGEKRAKVLFELLTATCEIALNLSIEKGILSAHEAKSAARCVLILDELANIKHNLKILSSLDEPDLKKILAFEETLRSQVAIRHCHILPADFDAAPKMPIDSLYVSPTISTGAHGTSDEDEQESLAGFLASAHRNVILEAVAKPHRHFFKVIMTHAISMKATNILI